MQLTRGKSHALNAPASLIPAAQYLRMSDEAQQYSIDNQKAAIQEYAASHGFEIVKTYADLGRSGVIAKNRTGLRELLRDVISGETEYAAILVYDVSRWGRFPNNDEAGHYEFLCLDSGVPLHYCAEPFANDGTATSSLLKALKRSMAAEFSRELGEKVFRGKKRIAGLGFWVGGSAGSGYRRLMVSASGKPKQRMEAGEQKNLTTDRVILVRGPRKEIEGVEQMFAMAAARKGCAEIARELNSKGFTNAGRPWSPSTVLNAVTNPKYTGCNVWNRHSQKLRGKRIRVARKDWTTKPGAFEPIVSQQTFALAQAKLPRIADYRWTNEEILRSVKRFLERNGRLSEAIFLKNRNMPCPHTIRKHFGSYARLYDLVDYQPDGQYLMQTTRMKNSHLLREELAGTIRELFPEHVEVTHLPTGTRSILRIDGAFMVSILFCAQKRKRRAGLHWEVIPCPAERDLITLLGRLNIGHDGVLSYHLFPRMAFKSHRSYGNDPWLHTGIRLLRLEDFYAMAKTLWVEKARMTVSNLEAQDYGSALQQRP